ncbi:MAG: spermidine synthase, partial [Acidobacteria bacterium]
MKRSTISVGLLLLGSGFCALVYQVAWLRLLRLIFGASTASTAAVLAIFMAGLGLGGAVLGRVVERRPNALRFYAHLEVGIALLAAASPLLIAAARAAYLGLGGSPALGGGATAVRLLLAALILGLPTTLMGGTLPAAARAVEGADDRGRRATAWLYGLNTLGGVLGAVLTTFVLLELLGIRQTLYLAAAINLLVA